MITRRIRRSLIVVVAGAMLTLAACGGSEEGKSKSSDGDLVEISIGDSTQTPDQLPLYIAADKGYFTDEGLKVNIVKLKTGGSATAAMVSGDIPINGGGPTSIISAVASNVVKAKSFYGLNNTYSYDLVVAPEIKSVEDLRGKTVALSSPGGAAEIAGLALLKSYGLSRDNLKVLNVGNTSDRLAAIAADRIQGTVVPSGSRHLAEAAGGKILVKSEDVDFALPLMAMNVTDKFAAENPDTVRAVVKAMDRAVEFMRDPSNRDAIADILTKDLGYNAADTDLAYTYYTRDIDGFYQVGGALDEKAFTNLLETATELDPTVGKLKLSDVLTTKFLAEGS